MRYIVLDKRNSKEILERKKYVEQTFNIYIILKKNVDYAEWVSIPESDIDLLMIVGHCDKVYNYLKNNKINEKNIVLVTCLLGKLKDFKITNKNIYISKNKNGYTDVFDGKNWNFNFDISESSLLFLG